MNTCGATNIDHRSPVVAFVHLTPFHPPRLGQNQSESYLFILCVQQQAAALIRLIATVGPCSISTEHHPLSRRSQHLGYSHLYSVQSEYCCCTRRMMQACRCCTCERPRDERGAQAACCSELWVAPVRSLAASCEFGVANVSRSQQCQSFVITPCPP